ncbi:nitroreductase family deazaflavin-dependent oxidoreductase [Frankia sp. CNm7]|uniref:Nitroreductase family deazaflavin-dependent oxidoreductase n=1 Tax=Frankia nepalensis TaxID=1836974 RepID=A0A937UQQ8_9ACTN|nr:nitroreductase family deazaflavin-dependent oxidoreductase [Frankia nepalensis]MBL7496859.1 nitroreductase family deazaflavin-dependent oxidoreductase [Frankia nepalensis]MBL7514683.1 nitroreductase family deazaflavin-dependent oxidoreductase [Frankia nepalensis]MBL7519433.1 nitroreductase family deazaflavin-dependent oxidoreductase [Frankia nepalensis]MBL7630482.1 nitroreductase family deazaflavin-dependent oxidoreductase [Frankia nepalensis]
MKIGPETRIGRMAQAFSLHPAFQRIGPSVVPKVDRTLHKISGGRLMIGQMMLPMIMLEHTGARSGLARRTPLATMPDGDGFWLVGSNYGRTGHPAWTANLLAHPDVAVVHRGKRRELRARLVEGEERAAMWPKLTTFWPGYAEYARMNDPALPTGRTLRVFRLDPR